VEPSAEEGVHLGLLMEASIGKSGQIITPLQVRNSIRQHSAMIVAIPILSGRTWAEIITTITPIMERRVGQLWAVSKTALGGITTKCTRCSGAGMLRQALGKDQMELYFGNRVSLDN